MRKTIATVIIVGLLWIGYTAWPLYDLLVLVRAIETRDVHTVTRHVYFDAVRVSLTDQVVAAYVRRTGIKISPFAQSMAASALGIADPIVKKLISPEALSELLAIGWPVTVVPDPPPGTVGINPEHDWDRLADFWKFGIWLWQVRSGCAVRVATAATLPSYVPTFAVALAIGRRHASGEYSELTRG
jgi:hypothetical protein